MVGLDLRAGRDTSTRARRLRKRSVQRPIYLVGSPHFIAPLDNPPEWGLLCKDGTYDPHRMPIITLPILAAATMVIATASAAPVALVEQEPQSVSEVGPGVILADFGRVAFGNLKLMPPADAKGEVTVRFGEAMKDGRINRKPPGTVRYSEVRATLNGSEPVIVTPRYIKDNSEGRGKVKTPAEWGVIAPFRWVEIEGWPRMPGKDQVKRRAAFADGWDDNAAGFHCSDEMLNRIWDLCRYSIKATTFAGVYVDGDRERTPYEADAYINQLGHYACDPDPRMARDTFEFLLKTPTWPTEWALHMPFILHADWMQTGDLKWLGEHFDAMKLLEARLRPDGLLASEEKHVKRDDIVDWPAGERDGFVMTPCNAVINAFYIRSLGLMEEMARALGRDGEADDYRKKTEAARAAFQTTFFDPARGIYRDGEGTEHASVHANFFPLAFGLVPEKNRSSVIAFIESKRMACSVYGSQYLLEGLFENDRGESALALISAPGDRSWRHMVESGTTITWEAWDQKYKPNQDWNHAWGTAPANLLPRFVLGIRPAEPGWKSVLIRPNPGPLTECRGKVPTPRGSITSEWKNGGTFSLKLSVPQQTPVLFELPAAPGANVRVNGEPIPFKQVGKRAVFRLEPKGPVAVEIGKSDHE